MGKERLGPICRVSGLHTVCSSVEAAESPVRSMYVYISGARARARVFPFWMPPLYLATTVISTTDVYFSSYGALGTKGGAQSTRVLSPFSAAGWAAAAVWAAAVQV